MTSLTCQTLLEIAQALDGMALDDLTRAEHKIFSLLVSAGVMQVDLREDEFRAEIVKTQAPAKMRWRLWYLNRHTKEWYVDTEHTWQPDTDRLDRHCDDWRGYRPFYIEWLPQE